MKAVRLLPHQGALVQAPFVYPDVSYFFLVAGYASGKTSALVKAIEYAVRSLLGKKDAEAHNPKVLVASKNLTFMKKTLTGLFEQDLRLSCSSYSYDKASNIISIGNVDVLLVPDEDEASIYGFSCACFKGGTRIMTSAGEKRIEDIDEADYVLTRRGFKKVRRAWCSGVRDCIEVNVEGSRIACTPDHRFIDSFGNEIEAQDLTEATSLVKIDTKEWQKWLSVSGKIDESLSLLTSMASGTTGIRIPSRTEKGAITPAQMRTGRKVAQLCTEICGLLSTAQFRKDMTCIIKTETFLTTLLETLSLLRGESAPRSIGGSSLKRRESRLLKQLRRLRRSLLNCGKTSGTGKRERLSSRSLLKEGALSAPANAAEESLRRMLPELLTALASARERLLAELQGQLAEQDTEAQEYALPAEKGSRQAGILRPRPARLTARTSSEAGRYAVYDIEVEDCHEFFANGVLVHNCAFVDELDELDTMTAMAVVKSVNDRCRQQVVGFRSPFMVYTTSSQGLKGTYQTVMHFKKSGIPYVLMRARTRDNIYLPEDYVRNMYAIYSDNERACLLEGKFVSIDSSLVFPDYNPAANRLDEDMYEYVREAGMTVYIGQDFNCVSGGALIKTVDGDVKMKDLREGDYVLTRKGYKKVLRKVCKGCKMVQEFNGSLTATPDHVAIAPQGDVPLCQARQFYCLPERSTGHARAVRKALKSIFKLKKSSFKAGFAGGFQAEASHAPDAFAAEKEPCIEIFISAVKEKLRQDFTSVTGLESTAAGLKALSALVRKSARKSILWQVLDWLLRSSSEDLSCAVSQLRESGRTDVYLKRLGRRVDILALLLALIAAKSLRQKYGQPSGAPSANINGTCSGKERLIKAWFGTARLVEDLLQEQVQQHIAQSTKIIGNDLPIKERGVQKVYDIEVEEAHEFYADGILVHNCFGNNAVAFAVLEGAIVALKDYEFPDIRRAPEVFRYDFPQSEIVWIPDMTYKEHFTEFKKELRAFGIRIAYRSCNPLVGDRNFACNKLFTARRLFVCPMCRGLEETLLTWQKDPRTGQPGKGGKGAPDHKGDCLGYVVHYLLSWKQELKPLYRVTLERLYAARNARGAAAAVVDASASTLSARGLSRIELEEAPNTEEP